MNKTMRDLLEQIKTKTAEAREKQTAGDIAAAESLLDEVDGLQRQYKVEEKLYRCDQSRQQQIEEEGGSVRADYEADCKQFAGYIKAMVAKESTPQNISYGANGAIIPTTIASDIITKVHEISPIVAGATTYHAKGKIMIPVYGDATDAGSNSHNITVAFADEFTALAADAGKFTSVDLEGFLIGALTLVGISVINSGAINVTAFVTSEMAKRIAMFLEDKYLNGASGKNVGALATTNSGNITAASATAITADELIDLQMAVPTAYQAGACWTMHPSALKAIRKLKNTNGDYLLLPDLSKEYPYTLLGKPVYLSDNMPTLAAGNKSVLYGDYSGLAANVRDEMSVQVLTEAFATAHAVGIVAWMEFDTDIGDNSKLAVLTQKAS